MEGGGGAKIASLCTLLFGLKNIFNKIPVLYIKSTTVISGKGLLL